MTRRYAEDGKIAIGDVFGRLTLETLPEYLLRDGQTRAVSWFRCECGERVQAVVWKVLRGTKRSCGCLSRDSRHQRARHGLSHTQLHNTWCAIKRRCYSPTETSYPYYGARGIQVCQEWIASFERFRDWAFANGFREGLTIERIDVNGHYCPDNCTWISQERQALNRRTTRYVTALGETKPLIEWIRDPRCTIDRTTFYVRLRRGFTEEEALLTPHQRKWTKRSA